MKKEILLFALLLFVFGCESKQPETDRTAGILKAQIDSLHTVIDSLSRAKPESEIIQNYLYTTFLSESPINWDPFPKGEVTGTAFRVFITTAEIYKMLYFEKVTFGIEGGNKQIVFQKKIDLEKDLNVIGEESSTIQFVDWMGYSAFILKVSDIDYEVSLLDDGKYSIKKVE
ncbi:MAG: hypothetical protein V1720_20435 [bacterium]